MTTPYHLTPGASQSNAFSAHFDGSPSIFATPQNRKDHGAAVAATLARKRDAGLRVAETPMTKRSRTTSVYSQARVGE